MNYEDNEEDNEVNQAEIQLKSYMEFSMNKCDSELLETISWAKIRKREKALLNKKNHTKKCTRIVIII